MRLDAEAATTGREGANSAKYSDETRAGQPQTTRTAFDLNGGVDVVVEKENMPRILFVSGFHPATRARDLAFEFER